jgi:hypothetical protein
MSTEQSEKCRVFLRKLDEDTRNERAERCLELQLITTGSQAQPQRKSGYMSEAASAYINGNYRSAIFCCACAVDQVFRFEYLKEPGNKYEELWQDGHQPRQLTFGNIIDKCKRGVKRLEPSIENARLLNCMRNGVAVHPLFIDVPCRSCTEKAVRDKLIRRDATALLKLVGDLDVEKRKNIEDTLLVSTIDEFECTFGKVISEESELPADSFTGFWVLIEQDLLRFLANRAWHITKDIFEGLYPVQQTSIS